MVTTARPPETVSNIRDQPGPCARLTDAELISLCRKYPGFDRIRSSLPQVDPSLFAGVTSTRMQPEVSEGAIGEQNCLLYQAINLPMSEVCGAFVHSLLDGRVAVMGEQRS